MSFQDKIEGFDIIKVPAEHIRFEKVRLEIGWDKRFLGVLKDDLTVNPVIHDVWAGRLDELCNNKNCDRLIPKRDMKDNIIKNSNNIVYEKCRGIGHLIKILVGQHRVKAKIDGKDKYVNMKVLHNKLTEAEEQLLMIKSDYENRDRPIWELGKRCLKLKDLGFTFKDISVQINMPTRDIGSHIKKYKYWKEYQTLGNNIKNHISVNFYIDIRSKITHKGFPGTDGQARQRSKSLAKVLAKFKQQNKIFTIDFYKMLFKQIRLFPNKSVYTIIHDLVNNNYDDYPPPFKYINCKELGMDIWKEMYKEAKKRYPNLLMTSSKAVKNRRKNDALHSFLKDIILLGWEQYKKRGI